MKVMLMSFYPNAKLYLAGRSPQEVSKMPNVSTASFKEMEIPNIPTLPHPNNMIMFRVIERSLVLLNRKTIETLQQIKINSGGEYKGMHSFTFFIY